MKIESLLASQGDCFLVTWNEEGEESSILIDTGIKGTYKHIKMKLTGIKNLIAIFITHVDYDHIGGMLKMIEDTNCPVDMKQVTVYINTPELIIGNNNDGKVNYGHGSNLESAINIKEIQKKGFYKGLTPDNKYKIGNANFTILSPTLDVLNKLKSKWTKEEIYKQYRKNNKTDNKVSSDVYRLKPYNDIVSEGDTLHKWENDLINASSIAFILEVEQKKILFLGDANPSIITNSLKEHGYSPQNKLSVDIVKISHHGSKYNTSKELLESLQCTDYIISTNGKGNSKHPHRETIVKLSEFGRKSKSTPLNIYTNYDLDQNRLLLENESTELNLKIENKNEFSF